MSNLGLIPALPRRLRWVGVTAATLVAVGALTAAADAWGDHSAARCGQPAEAVAARAASDEPEGWRNRTFEAAGCEAWLHLHRRGW